MRWQEKQAKIETAVYEAINELADEIGVEVPDYPLVIWVGKTVYFDDLCLPKRYLTQIEDWRSIFECRQRQRLSFYSHELKIIFIFRDDPHHILEEAAHALHLFLARPIAKGRTKEEKVCFDILMEVNGFLGARLLGLAAKNPYWKLPDMSRLTKKGLAALNKIYENRGDDLTDDFVHQQGYGLAECIHQAYLEGQIPRSFIRNLFLDRWSKKNSTIRKFKRLKNRFWSQRNRKLLKK